MNSSLFWHKNGRSQGQGVLEGWSSLGPQGLPGIGGTCRGICSVLSVPGGSPRADCSGCGWVWGFSKDGASTASPWWCLRGKTGFSWNISAFCVCSAPPVGTTERRELQPQPFLPREIPSPFIPGSSKVKLGCVWLGSWGQEESPEGADGDEQNSCRALLLPSLLPLSLLRDRNCAPKGTLGSSPSPVQRARFSPCCFKLSLMSLMWFPVQLTPPQPRSPAITASG